MQSSNRCDESPGGGGDPADRPDSWGQDTDRGQALATGFAHHLIKPVEPNQLADLIASRDPEKSRGH